MRALILTVFLATASIATAEEEPAQEAARLNAEIDALVERVNADRSRRDQAEAALDATEHDIARLADERDALEGRIDALEERVDALDRDSAEAAARLPALTRALADSLRVRYRLSRRPRASLVLDLDDPARVQRTLTYFDYLLAAQNRRVGALSAEIRDKLAIREQLAEERRALERAHREYDDKAAALEASRASRREQVALIARRLAGDNASIERKRAERARLEMLLDGIDAIRRAGSGGTRVAAGAPSVAPSPPPPAASGNGLAQLKGSLPMPANGRIVTHFRQPDPMSGIASSGVVIETGEGAEVHAVSAGQVVYADWFRGYGLLLVIDHGDGFMSLYGYNSRLLYPVGAYVDSGVPIATAGDTSGRVHSGVYFEIRRQGEAVDPLQWCDVRRG